MNTPKPQAPAPTAWHDLTSPRRLRRLLFGLRLRERLLPNERQALLLWAALAGFVGAWAGFAFKAGTAGLQWLLTQHTGGQVMVFEEIPWWQRLLVPTVGGAMAGAAFMLGRRLPKRRATDYMEAVALGDGVVPARHSVVRSLSAMCSIASGEAIGREGPLVQLSAMTASLLGRFRRMSTARRRLLVACGAAAGIASAYNAPIAGALFVAEIILGSIAMESLGPLLIASVVSAFTTRTVGNPAPLYAFAGFRLNNPWELALFALLGVVCGMGADGFQRLLRAGKMWFGGLPGPSAWRLGLGGLAVGLLAAWRPEVTGNGQGVVSAMLGGAYGWQSVALIGGLKLLAVTAAFGSGAVGGVFTPSLLMGGVMGFLFASGAGTVWPLDTLDQAGFALVGMGAFLAAATQAPVMAILMLFEMTLQYQIVLPLMVATVMAYQTARGLRAHTLYGESLQAGPRSALDKPLGAITVGDLMRPDPDSVGLKAQLGEVAEHFLREPVRELMVTSEEGRFLGAVLLPDVRPYLRDPLVAHTIIAADILRENLPTLTPDRNAADVVGMVAREDFEALPVVENGRLVGTLSRADLFLIVSDHTRRIAEA